MAPSSSAAAATVLTLAAVWCAALATLADRLDVSPTALRMVPEVPSRLDTAPVTSPTMPTTDCSKRSARSVSIARRACSSRRRAASVVFSCCAASSSVMSRMVTTARAMSPISSARRLPGTSARSSRAASAFRARVRAPSGRTMERASHRPSPAVAASTIRPIITRVRESARASSMASAWDCSAITVQGAPSTETVAAAPICGPLAAS